MILELLRKLKFILEKCIDWVAISFFSVVLIIALTQIVMRFAFRNPIVWAEELIRLMYVWICYIGWTIGTRNRTHIKISFLAHSLPPLYSKILQTFNCILIIIFSVLMVYYGREIMMSIAGRGRAVTIPVTFAIVYGIVPVTNTIITLYQFVDIAQIWKKQVPADGVVETNSSPRGRTAS